ncbi:MAG: ribose-phosphate pyrophosphokinase-like domain-containing protein [Candidatus Margulisiibacteriota bacterium]
MDLIRTARKHCAYFWVAGRANPRLNASLQAQLGKEPLPAKNDPFACGESYFKLDGNIGVHGQRVYVLQTLNPHEIANNLWDLRVTLSALTASGAECVVIIPHMPSQSASLTGRFLGNLNAFDIRGLVTYDFVFGKLPSSPQVLLSGSIPRINVGMPFLGFSSKGIIRQAVTRCQPEDLMITSLSGEVSHTAVGPVDKDAGRLAFELARDMFGEDGYRDHLVRSVPGKGPHVRGKLDGNVAGKHVLLFGGRLYGDKMLMPTIDAISAAQPSAITVAAVHLGSVRHDAFRLLSDDTRVGRVITTDSIQRPPEQQFEKLDVVSLAADLARIITEDALVD